MAVVTKEKIFSGVTLDMRLQWEDWMEKLPGKMETVSGPSGTGKTTLLGQTVDCAPEICSLVTSETNRKPRPSDLVHEYNYLSEEDFDQLVSTRKLAWQVSAHGNRYATTDRNTRIAFTVEGFHLVNCLPIIPASLPAEFFLSQKVTPFFIVAPPERELRRRFKERGDGPEEVERRIADCAEWNDWFESRRGCIPFKVIDGRLSKDEMARSFHKAINL